jgi:hypothetical protein
MAQQIDPDAAARAGVEEALYWLSVAMASAQEWSQFEVRTEPDINDQPACWFGPEKTWLEAELPGGHHRLCSD